MDGADLQQNLQIRMDGQQDGWMMRLVTEEIFCHVFGGLHVLQSSSFCCVASGCNFLVNKMILPRYFNGLRVQLQKFRLV
jgi:hypothetical protein